MKKTISNLINFTIILSLTIASVGCSKKDSLPTPALTLGMETLAATKAGGNIAFAVVSNTDWTVELPSGVSWIAASVLTGSGNGNVSLTLLPNDAAPREATVKVNYGTSFQSLKIQQGGYVKTYITLSELRAKGETTITQDLYVKGSLISDQVGGNSTSLKNIYISDGTAGMCIRLIADNTAMAVGTELEISLTGAVLAKYNGLLQINGLTNANMSATGKTTVIPAKTITAAQFKTGAYESMYVAITNVQVINADLSKTMVVGTAHTSIRMESSAGETFEMFNASYSEFKALNVPQLSGTLKGIANINVATYQLIPQNRADFADMTAARFGAAAVLTYGTPILGGALKKGVAFTVDNLITVPFTLATTGQAYNLSVAISGAGAAGITTPAVASGSFASGAGNITIPLAGTPTTAGNVTFTITGTGITTPIVLTGIVIDPASAKTLATWTFDTAPTAFPIASSTISTDDATGGSLTLAGFTAPFPTIGFTATSKTIYLSTWDLGKAWLFSFTPKAAISSGKTLSFVFKGYGSGTAPKDFVAEYSKDGTTWVPMGAAIEYTATLAPFTRTIVLNESLTGQVQIRLKDTSTVSISLGVVAAGGNSRLADVVISAF
ncbi:MAG: DUF5689 domain-containing protein [Prolixibacteraceae bacterium]